MVSVAAQREPAARLAVLLAALRIYLGLVFLLAVTSKLGGEPAFADRLPLILERLAENAHGFYHVFLERIVEPRARVFAGLVIGGELAVAASLLLGLATRAGAAIAMLLTLNYMLLKGAWFWSPSSNDAAFFVIALVVLVGAAGRTVGADAFLARRWPRVPLW